MRKIVIKKASLSNGNKYINNNVSRKNNKQAHKKLKITQQNSQTSLPNF